MLPLPSPASGLRADIAEKLLLIWVSENRGPREPPDEVTLPADLGVELALQLPQNARTRAAPPAHAIRAAVLMTEGNGRPRYGAGQICAIPG